MTDRSFREPHIEEIKPIDIGQPQGNPSSFAVNSRDHPLTWWWLRRLGFRFIQAGVDNQPHMLASVDHNQETGLEISPSQYRDGNQWTVWLRSDIAHSRCRFCYIRTVSRVGELIALMEAISGTFVWEIDFDADQFRDSLEREWRDCRRRYHEFATDARWGRVPGGL